MIVPLTKPADSFQLAARSIENLANFPPLGSNDIALLGDYDGVIDGLVADIEVATHHVHLLMYIFADAATGERIMQALARASRRGVTAASSSTPPVRDHQPAASSASSPLPGSA